MQGAWAFAAGGRMPQLEGSDLGLQQLLFGCFGLPMGLALNVICGGECHACSFRVRSRMYMAAAMQSSTAHSSEHHEQLVVGTCFPIIVLTQQLSIRQAQCKKC